MLNLCLDFDLCGNKHYFISKRGLSFNLNFPFKVFENISFLKFILASLFARFIIFLIERFGFLRFRFIGEPVFEFSSSSPPPTVAKCSARLWSSLSSEISSLHKLYFYKILFGFFVHKLEGDLTTSEQKLTMLGSVQKLSFSLIISRFLRLYLMLPNGEFTYDFFLWQSLRLKLVFLLGDSNILAVN